MTDDTPYADQTLMSHYLRRTEAEDLQTDAGQRAIVQTLDALRRQLEAPALPAQTLRLRRSANRTAPSHGLYIWGDVGRGKTMLMDLFFAQTDLVGKRRIHFDAFMQDMHAAVHLARTAGQKDPLIAAVATFAAGLRLLALDELQVRDIADATLLHRVFSHLFASGVVVVTTSNSPPAGLCGDGTKPELFKPVIDLLTGHLAVHTLSGPVDYRRRGAFKPQNYIFPNGARATAELDRLWSDFTGGQAGPKTLSIHGRDFVLPAFHDGMARMTFAHACAQPRSPADYLALCANLRLLMLDDVPRLTLGKFDVARRFIMLVDAVYDAKVRLILSAEVEPGQLYPDGVGAVSFQRLISRLHEMQGWT